MGQSGFDIHSIYIHVWWVGDDLMRYYTQVNTRVGCRNWDNRNNQIAHLLLLLLELVVIHVPRVHQPGVDHARSRPAATSSQHAD